MSQHPESASTTGSRGQDHPLPHGENNEQLPDLGLLDKWADMKDREQVREIRGNFFTTYKALILIWMAVVCICLGAEAFFTFMYGIELFSDVLLKWLAGPVSVGLFGGAMIQYLVGSRK